MAYRGAEKLRLYRSLLKGASRFPLASRRDVVGGEIKATFRNPLNVSLSEPEVDTKLALGWERAAAIATYAENMYWFHSRDEVDKAMLHHSQERDRERAAEFERLMREGSAPVLPEEAKTFRNVYHNLSPQYRKLFETPVQHSADVWKARGNHTADVGGPKQRVFIKRHKAILPQGW